MTFSLSPFGSGTSTTASRVPSATVLTGTPSLFAACAAAASGCRVPEVCSPSESSSTVAGTALFAGGRCPAARSAAPPRRERSIASPSAVPEPSRIWSSAARAASRSVVGASTSDARVENETMPTE